MREIGRGGMGVVYEAEQLSLGRRVALKVLPFAAALDGRQLQRFQNEAQAAANLHHTHIVPVYAVGCERGLHFYAMQLIHGRTLAALIRELRRREGQEAPEGGAPTGPATPGDTPPAARLSTEPWPRGAAFFRAVAQLGVQAAEALEHAHAVGVVHRDIKPANLLVEWRAGSDTPPVLWVTDFGLAQCQNQAGLTLSGDLLGTLRYMSPEQASGKRGAVDHRSDVYALGVTLYELLTLEPACPGAERAAVLHQVLHEEPVPPRRLNPAIPADLETVVLKAMAKEPEARYATAQELADDLRRFLDDKPVRARRPTVTQRLAKWARRHRAVVRTAIAGLCAAVVMLAVSAVLVWQQKREADTARDQATTNGRNAVEQRDLALQTINDLVSLVQKNLEDRPGMYKLRKELLDTAIAGLQRVMHSADQSAAIDHSTIVARQRMGDILMDVGQMEEAYRQFEKSRTLAETLVAANPHHEQAQADLRAAHDRLGAVCVLLGRAPEAREHYTRALRVAEGMAAADPASRSGRLGVAIAHGRLGQVGVELGDTKAALAACTKALALFKELAADPQDAEAQRLLSLAYQGLADVQSRLAADFPAARENQREAVKLMEAWAAAHPESLGAQVNLGGAYDRAGSLELAQGDAAVGRDYFRKAIAIARRLAEADRDNAKARQFMGMSYLNAAGASLKLGDLPAAQEEAQTALQLAQAAVTADPANAAAGRQLGTAYKRLGDVSRARKDLPAARAHYEKAVERAEALAAAQPRSFPVQYDLAEVYAKLGDVCHEQGDFEAALQVARKVLGPRTVVAETPPRLAASRRDLAFSYNELGYLLRKTGRGAEAEPPFRRALALYEELASRSPASPYDRFQYAMAHYNLATALVDVGPSPEVEPLFRRAADLLEKMVQEFPERQNYRTGLASCWYNLGNLLYDAGRLREARDSYGRAVAHNPEHANAQARLALVLCTDPDPKDRDPARAVQLTEALVAKKPNVSAYWTVLGVARYRAGDWKASRTALESASRLSPQGDGTAWFVLAMAHWQLGEKDKARAWYDKAVQWTEANKPKDEELRRFRAEAAAVLGLAGGPPAGGTAPDT